MMAKTPIYIINSYYYGPALGQLGCSLYGFVGGLTGTTSIMTLASISLDRYYAIVHPLNPFKRTTFRRAIIMMVCIWIYAAVFSSLPLFGVNKYTSEGYLTSSWCVPLFIIIYSYFNIYRMVKNAERMEAFVVGNVKQSARESFKFKSGMDKQRSEVKIALLAIVLISLWTIAWSPYAIVALLGIFGGKSLLTPLVSAIPAIFCKTASCINPFIYFINHPRFQRELRSHFQARFQSCFRTMKGTEENYYSTATYGGNENTTIEHNGQSSGISLVNISLKRRPIRTCSEGSNKSLRSSWNNKSHQTTPKETEMVTLPMEFASAAPNTGIDLHGQL